MYPLTLRQRRQPADGPHHRKLHQIESESHGHFQEFEAYAATSISQLRALPLDWSHPLHGLESNPTLALSTALAALVAPLGSCQMGAAHSPVGSVASW